MSLKKQGSFHEDADFIEIGSSPSRFETSFEEDKGLELDRSQVTPSPFELREQEMSQSGVKARLKEKLFINSILANSAQPQSCFSGNSKESSPEKSLSTQHKTSQRINTVFKF